MSVLIFGCTLEPGGTRAILSKIALKEERKKEGSRTILLKPNITGWRKVGMGMVPKTFFFVTLNITVENIQYVTHR